MKKSGGPIKNNPVTGYKWMDKGRKNSGDKKDGPICNAPINNYKWDTSKGRKNG